MLFPSLGPSSLPVVVAQPDERHANRAASVLERNKEEERAWNWEFHVTFFKYLNN